ncbi:ATP-binding protein [Mucilaginibacter terrae]|nr:ATP-binding protein [Mucilaginibacter terrae]
MKLTVPALSVLFSLIVFSLPQTFAQKRGQAEIDSLKNELVKAREDSTRLNLLCNIANAYSPAGQVTLAMKYVNEAEALSKRLNWKKGKFKWLYASAVANYYAANISVAIARFEQVGALADTLHLETQKHLINSYIASCFIGTGKYDEALKRIEANEPYLRKTRNNKILANDLLLKGGIYVKKAQYSEAIKYLNQALGYAKAAKNLPVIFAIHLNIAEAYVMSKNYQKALLICSQTEKMLKGYETWPQYTHFLAIRAMANQATGNYNKAIEDGLLIVKIGIAKSNQAELMQAYMNLAGIYAKLKDYEKAATNYKHALTAAKKIKQVSAAYLSGLNATIAQNLIEVEQYDQAVAYSKQAVTDALDMPTKINTLNALAWTYYKAKNYEQALINIKEAARLETDNKLKITGIYGTMGTIIRDAPDKTLLAAGIKPGERDMLMIKYLNIGWNESFESGNASSMENAHRELSLAYEKLHDYRAAFTHYKRYRDMADSLDNITKKTDTKQKIARFEYEKREDSLKYVQRLATQRLNEQMKLQKAEIKSKKYQSYFYMGGLATLVVLSGFIGLNYYNQRKANVLINQANADLNNKQEEITAQRDQLAEAITELKAAQTQLVQSEKMASLGELTAGIAHEIQNPLNFVNNFSEVSTEMLTELNDELVKGDIAEAQYLATELKEALEKINYHGKRADSIVKGMLEHSRASNGQKEPTDINKLTDEYLRLAYHGLRAKDKTFNADLITNFADDLPMANMIPQEMGRVMLNLFNNAFYAVHQKQKNIGGNYKPVVEVSTTLNNNLLQIIVKDNGTGIPDDIKDKIMQPFFTTKPTGQGTGLGLSLSYDVVVKVHGGKIAVDSIPGEQTTFIVSLPV